MQLHRLRDPQNVAVRAKRLGMVPVETPAFLRLSDGEVLGNPTPATAEAAVRIAPLPPVKPKLIAPDPVVVELREPRRADRTGRPAPTQQTGRRDTARPQATASRPGGRSSRTNEQNARDRARQSPGRTP